jgi:hypothetical protein
MITLQTALKPTGDFLEVVIVFVANAQIQK